VPALEHSRRYDRAAGFFSSGLVALAPIAFSHFIQGGGRIRLICSPNFSATDIAAIKSDADVTQMSREQVLKDLESLVEGKDESRILATLLSSLIAADILDLRIAVPNSSRGLFHDKVGIFTDMNRNVSFVGSANETMAAWSGFDNHEQIEVFTSWHNEDTLARTIEHQKLFDELWAGVRRGWKIMDPRDGKELLNRIVKPIDVASNGSKKHPLSPMATQFLFQTVSKAPGSNSKVFPISISCPSSFSTSNFASSVVIKFLS
jgi:hypothetical protein